MKEKIAAFYGPEEAATGSKDLKGDIILYLGEPIRKKYVRMMGGK